MSPKHATSSRIRFRIVVVTLFALMGAASWWANQAGLLPHRTPATAEVVGAP